MSNRKMLYGYQIQNGELTLVPEEAAVVKRVAGLYHRAEGRQSRQ